MMKDASLYLNRKPSLPFAKVSSWHLNEAPARVVTVHGI